MMMEHKDTMLIDLYGQMETLTTKLNETTQKLTQIEANNITCKEENASLVTARRVLTRACSRYQV